MTWLKLQLWVRGLPWRKERSWLWRSDTETGGRGVRRSPWRSGRQALTLALLRSSLHQRGCPVNLLRMRSEIFLMRKTGGTSWRLANLIVQYSENFFGTLLVTALVRWSALHAWLTCRLNVLPKRKLEMYCTKIEFSTYFENREITCVNICLFQ